MFLMSCAIIRKAVSTNVPVFADVSRKAMPREVYWEDACLDTCLAMLRDSKHSYEQLSQCYLDDGDLLGKLVLGDSEGLALGLFEGELDGNEVAGASEG